MIRGDRLRAILRFAGPGLLVAIHLQVGVLASPPAPAVIAPTPSAPPDAARWPGRIPAADDRGYDVLAYDLDLEFVGLPPQTPRIAGICRVRLRLLDEPPAELRLDLVDGLAVGEVLRDGLPAAWVQAGDTLRVALPATAAPGAEHEVAIAYAGSPSRHGPLLAGLLMRLRGVDSPDDTDHLGPTVGNVSQPYSSHSWFPCKDHPSDKARFALSVTAPDSLSVVATGRLLDVADLDRGRRRWDWATDHPVAPYLVGVAASAFASWQEACGDVPLEFHVFEEFLPAAREVLAPTCAMLRWLEDLLGPYPFTGEKYAQAMFGWGGAMENQTVTMLSPTVMAMPLQTARLFVVHELAHHWFGNSLTPASWRDIWLNEGFARYAEALWLEHAEGPPTARAYLALLRRADLFVGRGLLGDPDPVLPNSLVYDKGAWVLHMLRHELGDDVFFAALRAYAQDPDLALASTDRARMIAVFSRIAGRDLEPWLAPWLDTDAVPDLGARWAALGGGRVRIEVVQEQAGPFFPLTVPVRVYAGGEAHDLRLAMRQAIADAVITVGAPVDSVAIDPDGWLLRRTAATPPPGLTAALPGPNPTADRVELRFWLAGADELTLAVHDARGRRVREDRLGYRPATGTQAAGNEPHRWTWDGTDAAGRRLPAGVYWLELRGSRDRTVLKVTVVR